MKNIILIIFSVFILASCQKEIKIDLNSASPEYVIEGNISSDTAELPYVKISKTVNFDQVGIYPNIQGADISISDDAGNSEKLVYSGSYYLGTTLRGVAGRNYFLTVAIDGKTFTSNCKMPILVNFDSLKIEPSTFGGFGRDSLPTFIATPVFRDPITAGNNYRFIETINGRKDKTYIIYNDNVNNGEINNRPIVNFDNQIHKMDTVIIEMQCIDKDIYDYFFSLNASLGDGPGDGSTPANPISNIKGGALGYFSAHTSQKRGVRVK